MEIRQVFSPLLRWWWLIVLATVLAAGGAYYVAGEQPLMYSARTTLMVGRSISEPNPSDQDLRLSLQLADIYAEFATRDPVREATETALGLTRLPEYVVSVPGNGQFIEIVVSDTSPERAQAVAQELSNQLILRGPTTSQPEDLQRQVFVRDQLAYLEEKITLAQDEIAAKQDELAVQVSAEQIADAQSDITGLQSKLATLQTIYASLVSTLDPDAINILTVIEPAALPTRPMRTGAGTSILLSGVIGFMLAAGAAYVLEYFDNTLRPTGETTRVLQLPVLGYIGKIRGSWRGRIGRGGRRLTTEVEQRRLLEAFRVLRANLEFSGFGNSLKVLLVTSPGPRDGKSTVAANLAYAMAMSRQKVLLVDTDLRNPSLRLILDGNNRKGRSDMFPGNFEVRRQEENLYLLTRASPTTHSSEFLGSETMNQTLAKLRQVSDIVIMDSPAYPLVDAAILSSKADAVLLVIRPGHTKEQSARAMLEQLKQAGANTLGVVVNQLEGAQTRQIALYATVSDSNGNHRPRVVESKRRGKPLRLRPEEGRSTPGSQPGSAPD